MNGPARYRLDPGITVAGIRFERGSPEQRAGKFLDRVVVVVANLRLPVLERSFSRCALTKKEKRVRIPGRPQPQIELRVTPRGAVVGRLGDRHLQRELRQTGEAAVDIDARYGRDRIYADLRGALTRDLVERGDAQCVSRCRAESAGRQNIATAHGDVLLRAERTDAHHRAAG
ncbi:hypothetical protein FVF58_35785 [Paraburkholderia panacisoli]|uniref:Uncharacterized protein n=1 Tax=Paraburkholderia panacisoli TaxID=2603818 RepID=A0A5B0GNT0_9BURK|nr:hypothetical protein [Paraburkholderia panacisoli]KAA1003610.1 hypothetical protein FVF58_35785 [Paraburkholderia panacisoli]